MANQNGNGRNIPRSEENRPSWRPQDQYDPRGDEGDDRYFDTDRERDRYFMDRDRRAGGHWEDQRDRRTDYYGQGQSGYASGRNEGDRGMRFEARNQAYGGYQDRDSGMGVDERFTGRGGEDYWRERRDRTHHDRPGGQQGMPGVGQQTMYGYGQEGFGSRSPEYKSQWTLNQERPREIGGHRGKGPVGFTRSDEKIREQVCEMLTDDDHIDATHIEVIVKHGEVILTGMVDDRRMKRMAEEVAEHVPGVNDVQNQLRVRGNPSTPSAVGKQETVASDKKHRA